jgi:hypothetical protein
MFHGQPRLPRPQTNSILPLYDGRGGVRKGSPMSISFHLVLMVETLHLVSCGVNDIIADF